MMLNQHSKNRMSARLPLAAFIAVSMGIHISVLLVHPEQSSIELGVDSKNEISVHIIQAAKQDSRKKPVQPVKAIQQAHETGPGHKLPTTAPAKHSKQQQLQSRASFRQKKIVGQLQQELARFFYYPPQAQRRGIQGQVIIGFRLNQQGRINSVSISKSSGYTVLDNAALDAFNQASRIFSTSASRISMYLQIPVRFQLSGG